MPVRSSASSRTLADAATGRLRIMQRKGVKAAIKLEEIFWSQLKDFAKEDKTTVSQLVFGIFDQNPGSGNRTALLRCYCIDRSRRMVSVNRLNAETFDMLALIAACPTPVALITPERKVVAFNPSFGDLLSSIRGDAKGRAIQFSFSVPLTRIHRSLIEQPRRITVYQIGILAGEAKSRQYLARFAMADRSKGLDSLLVVFFDDRPGVRKA